MSSAGHILDMIIRFRNNEALRKATRNRYKEVKEAYQKHAYKHIHYYQDKELTGAELKIIKKKIRSGIIKERRQVILKSAITLLLTLMIISYLMYRLIRE